MSGGRAVVLIGVGQRTVRPGEPGVGALPLEGASDPLALLAAAARDALDDARLGKSAIGAIDTIGLVDALAWPAKNPVRLLAEALGAKPKRELVTKVGGESPLVLLNHVARAIERGEIDVALIGGTHVIKTLRAASKAGVRLELPLGGDGEPIAITQNKAGSSAREGAYGLMLPASVYPLFENALRARRGLSLDEHRRRMGALMEPFTRVAAANPHAWFPVPRSAEELVKPTPANRMVAFPYTKYLNAVIETDQAAAILLASEEAARRLGAAQDRRVWWWGGGQAVEDPWFPTERPDFADCPALASAAQGALADAGVTVDEIARFDLYSCFPVAVELACDLLGIAEDDPRGLTVTGGLPYAGGPGNNYSLHSAAAMVEKLRAEGGRGLVTGNGWYLTKHSAAVLGASPPAPGRSRNAPAAAPRAAATIEFADAADGAATVETYTVLHDRSGAPERGLVVGRQGDGRRFLADVAADRAGLEAFVAAEQVGRHGRVSNPNGRNRFEPR